MLTLEGRDTVAGQTNDDVYILNDDLKRLDRGKALPDDADDPFDDELDQSSHLLYIHYGFDVRLLPPDVPRRPGAGAQYR